MLQSRMWNDLVTIDAKAGISFRASVLSTTIAHFNATLEDAIAKINSDLLGIINPQGSFLQHSFLDNSLQDNSLFGHAFLDKRPLLKQDPLPMVFGIKDDLDKIDDEMTVVIFKGRLLLDNTLLLLQHLPPLSQVDQDSAPFVMVITGDKGKQAVRVVRVSKVVGVLMLNANINVSVSVNLSNQVLSLLGFVGKHPLVDSGCSTNFVSTTLVSKLRLPTQQSVEAFQVELADGSYLQCNKKVQQLEFQIQNYQDQLGFSVMPLSHYDMILGQSWLYQYDPIISFRDHSIRFFSSKSRDGITWSFQHTANYNGICYASEALVRKRDCTTALVMLREAEDDTEVQSEDSATDTEYLQKPFFHQFLDLFPDVLPTTLPPRCPVDHTIDLIPGQPPPMRAPYRVSYSESQEIQRQLEDLLDKGHIRLSKSPFRAPVLLVKKDGSMRICIDYRALNKQTIKNKFPLPRIDELFDQLLGAKIVFEVLRTNVLYINKKKSQFFKDHVEYLGHIISGNGVAVDPKKIQVIMEWSFPLTIWDVRSFLGLANFYHTKVHKFSDIAAPLTELTKRDKLQWSSEAESFFNDLKQALTTPVLAIADPTQPFDVMTDAFDRASGGVLMQNDRVIAFDSHNISAIQMRYPVYDKEFLAIVHAYRTWKHYLRGTDSIVRTDHQCLTYIFTQPVMNPRQGRWVEFLANFYMVIQYVPQEEFNCQSRTWLFLAYVISFVSLAGSVGLLIQDALVDSAASSWTGVAGVLQCVFILASGIIYWTSRTGDL
ncbi:hypothetical protein L7F22_040009 [Adiantum nelumboides]|nr:hypothetical protein [Adiantum nelumboides]